AIRSGIKLPYTYDVGYYHRFTTRIGMYVGVQMVTFPFSGTQTGIMNLLGADPNMTAILRESMGFGIGLDHGWQYHFGSDRRRYYVGFSVQWMTLPKQDINDKVIDDSFIENPIDGCPTLEDCPINPMHHLYDSEKLTINTNYVNVMATFGYTIFLQHKNEIRLEGSLAKTIASRHYLHSDYRYISPFTDAVNDGLQDIMLKYGWFPSINVYYIHKLRL
ncbi:MAG: hypothetical protein KAH25_02860, partial [Bacteroidales bacterium]|nr:hypothetical protein [Bacteroidales bacterium]